MNIGGGSSIAIESTNSNRTNQTVEDPRARAFAAAPRLAPLRASGRLAVTTGDNRVTEDTGAIARANA
jgi:hypothetical protein